MTDSSEPSGPRREEEPSDGPRGPILYLQGAETGRVALAALLIREEGASAPELRTAEAAVAAEPVLVRDGRQVLRYAFSLPMAADAWYELAGERYPVNTDFRGDLRIAYVSCNGQEEGDRSRDESERNVLWRRLQSEHQQAPFQLLLHGGDQIYADEILETDPRLREWSRRSLGRKRRSGPSASTELEEVLRQGFFRRYMEVLGQPATDWLMARVPSLAMWDDHDICDGWGSLRPEKLDAPIGRALFAAARDHFLLFQLGARPGELPAICPDRSGTSLTWEVRLPGLHLIAPDLRSERRPERVIGEAGWRALEESLQAVKEGRVLLLSSVPALGPRLSWVERFLHLVPSMQKYEDDLRDQWQSHAHRAEWRRFLERLAALHADPATPVTLLSGEIHLATRGTFDVPPAPIQQLVASGITHPAPPGGYARGLSLLARLGESPVPGHAIRLHPLPGSSIIYTAQRNHLVLEREGEAWRAEWELEEGGRTPPLDL